MAHINLLPWREEKRKEQQRHYLSVVGFAMAITGVLLVLVHFHYEGRIDYQARRNQFLTNEIKILDDKIKDIKDLEATRKRLVERMSVIQNLQATRPGIVHLFDELVKTLPDGTYLTSVEQNSLDLTLKGKAESNARVSAYMRHIDDSEWLENPTLDVIETQKQSASRTSDFTLKAKQILPKDEMENSNG